MKKFYILGALLLLLSVHHVHASSYPDGCTATTKYSATTGHLCVLQTCQPGDLYDSQTGQPCSLGNYLPGCTSFIGYSTSTGVKCDSTTATPISQTPITTTSGSDTSFQFDDLWMGNQLNNYMVSPIGSPIVYGWKTSFQSTIRDASKAVVDGVTVTSTIDGADLQTYKTGGWMVNHWDGIINGTQSYYYASLGFEADGLTPGQHVLSVTVNGVTKSLTFTVPPNTNVS